jgi:acetoin utilization protein AcuB
MDRVMTPIPVTITPDATLFEARSAMSRYRIRHLPVIDDGKPVSVVCDRDLGVAEVIFKETERTPAAHVVRLLGDTRVHRVAPNATIDSVLRDMFAERLDFVLVVDKGHLVGIFTAVDACRLLADARRPNDWMTSRH